MLKYEITLLGGGGVLDTKEVQVAADDDYGVRDALIKWLEGDHVVLDHGDSIKIKAVRG